MRLGGQVTHACSRALQADQKYFDRAATAYGKQGEKATCVPDKPTFKDPELRNGVRLACTGRTTAAEYFARKHFVHACTTAAVNAAYVVPISFLKQKHIAPARGVARAQIEYVPTPEEELRLFAATARLLVQAATEPDIDILAGLWRQLGIASGRSGAAVSLHWDTWHRLRTKWTVVLAPEHPICWQVSDAVVQPAKNIPPQVVLLCSCLPFALSAACERVDLAEALQASSTELEVIARRTSRPPKPVFSVRGSPARDVFSPSKRQKAAPVQCNNPAQPSRELVMQEVVHSDVKSDQAAFNPAASKIGTEACSQERGSSNGSRGITLHHTNFELVTAVLGNQQLPARANIYFVEQHQAGAMFVASVPGMQCHESRCRPCARVVSAWQP